MVTNGLEIADAFFTVVIACLEKKIAETNSKLQGSESSLLAKKGLKHSESTQWMRFSCFVHYYSIQ